MEKGWFKFQEDIKSIFTEMGCDAQSNAKLVGARTTHDIDVLIRSRYLGQPIQWIIEAKNWNKKVSKLHVLALRKIVEETGADKGILVSQKGFQSGALEAAELSNIELLTFDQLIELTKEIFHKDILKTYVRRMNYILNRYFSHSKSIRVEFGLRHDTWDPHVDFNVYFM
ncbi:MAG: restriction endonuclease [Pedobacter sp.]|nr:MAG: restriction endonuclease [Pedobacter sp.]